MIGIYICTNAYVIPVKLPLISTEKSRETSAVFTWMANPDLQVRGGHPDPKIRGSPGLQNLFSALRASFWAKNKGRPPGPSPGSATVHYVKEFVRLTMILEFFSLIYLSVWVNPLLMAVLTLIGKPFIVGLPYLRLKSAITGPHTLMHLFFITFFSWMVELD